ncbi:MAG: autotransporter-associated beta strand repeat-containing protein [Thermoguttaceae bacterium]|nr:autotransporter-associated beta strand repeat-containing protein [Thermoguttaceae bacterium]
MKRLSNLDFAISALQRLRRLSRGKAAPSNKYLALLAALAFTPGFTSAATVTIDGGTYTASTPYVSTNGSGDSYVFTNGGYFSSNSSGNITYTGTFSGNGNIKLLSTASRPQIHFNSSMNGYAGTVEVTGSNWFAINDPNKGSADTRWILNCDPDTGILLNNVTSSPEDPIRFGTIESKGRVRPIGNRGGITNYIEVGNLMTEGTVTKFSGAIYDWNGDYTHVTKVGAGTWVVTNTQSFTGGLHIKEGTLQIGDGGGNGKLQDNLSVIIEEGASFGYSRGWHQNEPLNRNETILVKGGTIYQTGEQTMCLTNITFENGGFVKSYSTNNKGLNLNDLKLTGDKENSRVTFTTSKDDIYLTGSLTGGENQEIYLTGVRGKWLRVNVTDASQFYGTITAGPGNGATNTGTWISLNGNAMDFSNATFNPNPGQGIDAGILLEYNPTDKVLKLGAVSGNGIIRTNGSSAKGKTFNIQVGANNKDTVFSGGFVTYENSNYNIEKVGTGRWIIASNGDKYKSVTGTLEYYYNNYTGTTTITEGTIQLGDYDPVTRTGGKTGYLGRTDSTNAADMTKIIIGENGTLAFGRVGENVSYYNSIESNGGTIEIVNPKQSDYLVLRGPVTGSFTKTGEGTLAMGSSNGDKLTQITVKEGTLRNYAAHRLGDGKTKIVLDGGRFEEMDSGIWLYNKFEILSDSTVNTPTNFAIATELTGNSNATLSVTGNGKLVLAGKTNAFQGTFHVKDTATLQIGGKNDGHINNTSKIIVDKGAFYGYDRSGDINSLIKPGNLITLSGTLFNAGERPLQYTNVHVTNEGAAFKNSGKARLIANIKKADHSVFTLDGNANDSVEIRFSTQDNNIFIDGIKSVNNFNSIIYLNEGPRSNFLNLMGDMSTFRGTVKVEGDRWFSFQSGTALGSELAVWETNMTKDSGVLFNSWELIDKTVKMGDLTGNGYVRIGNTDTMSGTINLEVGALGNDSSFSGYLGQYNNDPQTLHVIKVGDGTWSFTSDNQVQNINYNNKANITVREGTLELKRAANQVSAAAMTVEGGTLLISENNQKISGALTLKGGALNVAEGKSFTHGTINVTGGRSTVSAINGNIVGNVNVASGQLRIGQPLNLTGDISLTNDSLLMVDVKGPGVADKVKIDGKVILDSSSKIDWLLPEEFENLDYFELFTADEIVMEDGSPVDWETVMEDLDGWAVSEDENEFGEMVVALTKDLSLPEPSTWAIMLMGIFGIGFLRKKRTAK